MSYTKAQYTPSDLDFHKGNPLIEALPPFLSYGSGYFRSLLEKAPRRFHPQATRGQRGAWLLGLASELFVPVSRTIQLMEMMDMVLRNGYVGRDSPTEEEVREIQEAYERMQRGEKVGPVDFSRLNPRAYRGEPMTIALVGCSGVGKSYSVNQILNQYSQVIRHFPPRVPEAFDQIVYLKVECPHEGSVKSLCINILAQIDAVTGEDWVSKFTKGRPTAEVLKIRVTHLLDLHKVGLLVIDEIQNLTASKKSREELFNFIVSLGNSLSVPILFIGTPKIMKFIQKDFRIARRFGNCGVFKWDRMARESRDWRILFDALWNCNVLDSAPAQCPGELENAFYDYSQGVPDIFVKLFTLAQLRAMTRKDQALTPELVKWIFNEHFKSVEPIILALKSNDLSALEKYEDVSLNTSYNEAAAKLVDELYEKDQAENSDSSSILNDAAAAQMVKKAGEAIQPTPDRLVEVLTSMVSESGLTEEQHQKLLGVLESFKKETKSQ